MRLMREMPDLSETPPCARKHVDAHTLAQHRVAMESAHARMKIALHGCE